ncbi:MAG: EF-P lysine aminoacylase GenX, partial [Pseudomonadota bacterium]|nr:EF-P lysine aminoacylase GenX [Pseudomonadota bacterium]
YRVGWNHHRLIEEVTALLGAAMAMVDRATTFEKISYRDLYLRQLGIDSMTASVDELREALGDVRIDPAGLTRDDWLDLLMTHRIQPGFQTDHLTVVHDYPASQSALARIRAGDPPVAERFECYLGPLELANGYHELTDAHEQRRRFERDRGTREQRGDVVPPIDEHLLAALEQGLPPCAGVALGIDRLLMAMLGSQSIDEVLAFPFPRA